MQVLLPLVVTFECFFEGIFIKCWWCPICFYGVTLLWSLFLTGNISHNARVWVHSSWNHPMAVACMSLGRSWAVNLPEKVLHFGWVFLKKSNKEALFFMSFVYLFSASSLKKRKWMISYWFSIQLLKSYYEWTLIKVGYECAFHTYGFGSSNFKGILHTVTYKYFIISIKITVVKEWK